MDFNEGDIKDDIDYEFSDTTNNNIINNSNNNNNNNNNNQEQYPHHQRNVLISLQSSFTDGAESKLVCFICQRLYREPRILTCLHTFCSACILNLQTYPCNGNDVGSSTSSHEHSIPSDSLVKNTTSKDNGKKQHGGCERRSRPETSRRTQRESSRSASITRGLSEDRRGLSEDRRGLSEDRRNVGGTLPKGKSRFSRFMQEKMIRSSSYGDRFNDKTLNLTIWPEAPQISKEENQTTLKRSTSFTGDIKSRQMYRKSVVSSTSFGSSFNDDVTHPRKSPPGDEITQKGGKRVILCPKCLREVEISKTLEELPRNFMLERLVAKEILIQTRLSESRCDYCIQQKGTGMAGEVEGQPDVIAFCVDCQASLCTTCMAKHRKSSLKKGHQLIVLERAKVTTTAEGKLAKNSSSGSSGDYYSFSDSMTTIPEAVKEESESLKENPVGKKASKGPNLIGNVKKLKLPNLQNFGKLFNWKSSSRQNSQTALEKDSRQKCAPTKLIMNSIHSNGLVNDAFEDRRFTTAISNPKHNRLLPMETLESYRIGQESRMRDLPHGLKKVAGDSDDSQMRVDPHHVIPCSKHPDEALKMFCVTCELCVCRECVVMEHKDHQWELLTRHLFQRQMEEVDQLIQQVLPRVQDVDLQLTFLDEVKDGLVERSKEVAQRINCFMDSYVEAVQKHREHLLEQVASLVSAQECKMDVTRTHLHDMRSDVEHTCRFVAELLTGSSDLEILSMKKLITRRLHGFDEYGSRNHLPTDTFIQFIPTVAGEVIGNFQMFGKVVDNAPCAARSVLQTEGLAEAIVSQKCVVALNVCDAEANSYTGCDVKIRAWIVADGKGSVPVDTQDSLRNGVYSLVFTPNSRGTHFLHVTVNGSSVMNSPSKFTVKHRRHRHQGAWQCCTVCQTGGRRDVTCGCGFSNAEGGYLGCDHRASGHLGAYHWSCCGQTVKHSHCKRRESSTRRRQVTL